MTKNCTVPPAVAGWSAQIFATSRTHSSVRLWQKYIFEAGADRRSGPWSAAPLPQPAAPRPRSCRSGRTTPRPGRGCRCSSRRATGPDPASRPAARSAARPARRRSAACCQASRRAAARGDAPAEVVGEGHDRVDHRLVADLGLAEAHHDVPGLDRRRPTPRPRPPARRRRAPGRGSAGSAPRSPRTCRRPGRTRRRRPRRGSCRRPHRPSAADRAALAPARLPRCMPIPWSPSPATESIRPSSSACSAITSAVRASRPATTRRRLAGTRHWPAGSSSARPAAASASTRSRCATEPRRKAGVSAGAVQSRSSSSSSTEQRQRAPGHVEARAELADLGVDDLDAGGAEQPVDAAVDDEQLLVLHAAQAVEDRHHAGAGHVDARGHLVEQARDEQLGELVRGGHVGLVDAGLAVDAQPDRHPPLRHGEQRLRLRRAGCSRRRRRRTTGCGRWRGAPPARPRRAMRPPRRRRWRP